MKLTWKKTMILLSGLTLLLGGCSQNMNVSAEEIIHQVIESEDEMNEYYGESIMKLYEGDELTMDSVTMEYVSADGKKKLITIDEAAEQEFTVLNDGGKITMYDKARNEAFEEELGMDMLGALSPKEQIKTMIESMKETHDYELVEEGEVLGFDTYHLKLKAKEQDNLIGDMDLWIDKKTWFILKMKAITGDARTEMEYTELDLSPTFEGDTFTLDIPEDVEIKNLMDSFGPDSVTKEEVEEALGQPFLMFSEDEIILSDIQMYEPSEGLDRYEVEVSYESEESIPLFIMSIFPAPEDMPIKDSEVKVRGNNADFDDTINSIMWDEEGLRYNILLSNPDVEREDILLMTEKMILSSED